MGVKIGAMHTMTLNLTLSRACDDQRAALRYLARPRWVLRIFAGLFSARAARRLRRMAERLAREVLDVEELARLVDAVDDESPSLIDPDFRLAEIFTAMLAGTQALHRETVTLARLVENWIGAAPLHEAARQLAAVYAESYTAICRLSWAIGEHDASRAPRLPGYVASTPADIEALLERIAAGA